MRKIRKNKVVPKAFFEKHLAVNDLFDDVIFTNVSSIQFNSNKLTNMLTSPKHSVNMCMPKHEHLLKLHVWAGISRKRQTSITIFDSIMDSTGQQPKTLFTSKQSKMATPEFRPGQWFNPTKWFGISLSAMCQKMN
ncbi:hypothetical protein DPMN_023425 [Dreissena polymorpha]|uniref:Uncharacterized protein n=1 Tax=Dreissena polymorpha TaxID=45954 RepID=A0A9D4LMB8_DREPO|nr:hypothetical protein DPMN_023425 [Dreissena polymorpha]